MNEDGKGRSKKIKNKKMIKQITCSFVKNRYYKENSYNGEFVTNRGEKPTLYMDIE